MKILERILLGLCWLGGIVFAGVLLAGIGFATTHWHHHHHKAAQGHSNSWWFGYGDQPTAGEDCRTTIENEVGVGGFHGNVTEAINGCRASQGLQPLNSPPPPATTQQQQQSDGYTVGETFTANCQNYKSAPDGVDDLGVNHGVHVVSVDGMTNPPPNGDPWSAVSAYCSFWETTGLNQDPDGVPVGPDGPSIVVQITTASQADAVTDPFAN